MAWEAHSLWPLIYLLLLAHGTSRRGPGLQSRLQSRLQCLFSPVTCHRLSPAAAAAAFGRFWVWMFFPFLFVAVDRLLLWQRQRYPLVLTSVRARAR